MQERSVVHETIVMERSFKAIPERVFAAWANPETRRQWAVPNGDWESAEEGDDFRVGGREVSRFGPKGDPRFKAVTNYFDIVRNQRIVMAGTMYAADVPISCSLATVEFLADASGTRMVYTEQAAFLDGLDNADSRRQGWRINLDKLDAYLTGPALNHEAQQDLIAHRRSPHLNSERSGSPTRLHT